MGKQKNVVLFVTSGAVVAIFAMFAFILSRMGFFTFTGDESSAKIVAAAIALLGGLFSALITLMGLILKHSIDMKSIALQEQTEARERLESERNNQLAQDAERRLRVEAAIQSIGLLSSSSGHDVPDTQRAGVILTLGDLEMFPIALSLVEQMIPKSRIDAGTACWLFDRALRSGDEEIQVQAAMSVTDHTHRMLLPHGAALFPSALLDETIGALPEAARRNAVWAIIDLIMLRTVQEWSPNVFVTLVDALHYVWKSEKEDDIRTDAAVALLTCMRTYPRDYTIRFMFGTEVIGDLVDALEPFENMTIQGNAFDGLPRSEALANWFDGAAVTVPAA